MSNGIINPDFYPLSHALKIIHKTTEKKVIFALESYANGKGTTDDEIRIRTWLDPRKNPEKGTDNYKVARSLVWYIAKHVLKIPSFQNEKFPFE